MSRWRSIQSWRERLWRRDRAERETDAELQFHLERYAEDLVRAGLAPEAAKRRARLDFGSVERAREECREARGARLLQEAWRDLRYGLRQMRRHPGFTLVAVLTLMLGIGTNTAVFSIVDAVLLHPLPYRHANRLLKLDLRQPGNNSDLVPYPAYVQLLRHATDLRRLAGYSTWPVSYRRHGHRSSASGCFVSPSFFPLLGLQAAKGRLFISSDANQPVAIISYRFWQQRWHGLPAAVGKVLPINNRNVMIVGVLPQGERFPFLYGSPEIWLPMRRGAIAQARSSMFGPAINPLIFSSVAVIGELAPGASRDAATAQAQTLVSDWMRKSRPKTHYFFALVPLQEEVVHGFRRATLLLFLAAGAMLLIAIFNLAHLLLARTISRRPELATRHALGAGRTAIARQMFFESLVMTLPGAGLGVVTAGLLLRAFQAFIDLNLPEFHVVILNRDVLAFSVLAALLVTLFFGLLPLFHLRSWAAPEALVQASGGRGGGESRSSRRLRQSLVVGQVALTLTLLACTGLLFRSLLALTAVQPGFDPHHLMETSAILPRTLYPSPASQIQFVSNLHERFQAQPGVVEAAVATDPPLAPVTALISSSYQAAGRAQPAGDPMAAVLPVTPGFFQKLRIPLLSGRDFRAGDSAESEPVCIIDRKVVQTAFAGGQNPVGQHLLILHKKSFRIVGVAGDTIEGSLGAAPPAAVYFPYAQFSMPVVSLVVRTGPPVASAAPAIRRLLGQIAPGVPFTSPESVEARISDHAAPNRFRVGLAAAFALLALLLAAIGVYGTAAYAVSRETHGIGIRMALGASPRRVLRSQLARSLRLAALGAGLGLAIAWFALGLLRHFLFHVAPRDPVALAAATLLLAIVAFVASFLPARRASRLDPAQALRHE